MNKLKLILDLTGLFVSIAAGLLAIGNQITAIPGIPGWIVNGWPVVIVAATIIDRVGNIIISYLNPKTEPKVP